MDRDAAALTAYALVEGGVASGLNGPDEGRGGVATDLIDLGDGRLSFRLLPLGRA